MRNNTSGKVLTIFLLISAVLLVSLTAISIFFFQKESEQRKTAELELDRSLKNGMRLEEELKDAKKQLFVLEEKNKEADEKINGLLDDLDLEKGLRDQAKTENASLKEQLEKIKKVKDDTQQKIDEALKESQDKIAQLQEQLKEEKSKTQELVNKFSSMGQENKDLKEKVVQIGGDVMPPPVADPASLAKAMEEVNKEVDLDKIVIAPAKKPDGRILSVDTDTEFVIVNLGQKDGVLLGNIMSVYRGNDYLGDIKVTRVQAEMFAADFIPPFSSRKVRKNDQVVFKDEING